MDEMETISNDHLYFFYPKALDTQYRRLTGISLHQANLPELRGAVFVQLGKMPKLRKPSSRRLKVQAKRKRLGLPVDGKIAPCTRKQCYAVATKVDRIIPSKENNRKDRQHRCLQYIPIP